MSETSKKALIALLGIAILVVVYMYVFQPAQEDIDALNGEISTLKTRLADLTEKEKQKEQLIFASVQEKFDAAKQAEGYRLVSRARMETLEDAYAALKNKSDAIQEMTYKPLIQRIKDYLLGLAAVAVLLMFLSMLRARIKAIKDAREAMKKYKDALKLNGSDEYPTI